MKNKLKWIVVILMPIAVLGGIGALRRNMTARNLEWPTQMEYSPASLSQTENPVLPGSMTQQPPVSGTIPRGFEPFHYGPGPQEAERAGSDLKNPFQPTSENLARGEYIFS